MISLGSGLRLEVMAGARVSATRSQRGHLPASDPASVGLHVPEP